MHSPAHAVCHSHTSLRRLPIAACFNDGEVRVCHTESQNKTRQVMADMRVYASVDEVCRHSQCLRFTSQWSITQCLNDIYSPYALA